MVVVIRCTGLVGRGGDDGSVTLCGCAMLQLTGKANVLLRQVFEHLNIVDRQYFGLRFFDDDGAEPVSFSSSWKFPSFDIGFLEVGGIRCLFVIVITVIISFRVCR